MVDERNPFIKLLHEYNFVNNSIQEFCRLYKVNEKTVKKYLKKFNIKYNSRDWNPSENLERDVNGCFISLMDRFEYNSDNKIVPKCKVLKKKSPTLIIEKSNVPKLVVEKSNVGQKLNKSKITKDLKKALNLA